MIKKTTRRLGGDNEAEIQGGLLRKKNVYKEGNNEITTQCVHIIQVFSGVRGKKNKNNITQATLDTKQQHMRTNVLVKPKKPKLVTPD